MYLYLLFIDIYYYNNDKRYFQYPTFEFFLIYQNIKLTTFELLHK